MTVPRSEIESVIAGIALSVNATWRSSTLFWKSLIFAAGPPSAWASLLAPSDSMRFNALMTMSLVSKPSAAYSFRSPAATPVSSEMACSTKGACSAMLRNSSPRNAPEPNACNNCVNAADASAAVAPPRTAAVLKPPNVEVMSFSETPNGRKRANASAND